MVKTTYPVLLVSHTQAQTPSSWLASLAQNTTLTHTPQSSFSVERKIQGLMSRKQPGKRVE